MCIFAFKNPNLAQSLKTFARPYGRTVAAFRNSATWLLKQQEDRVGLKESKGRGRGLRDGGARGGGVRGGVVRSKGVRGGAVRGRGARGGRGGVVGRVARARGQ